MSALFPSQISQLNKMLLGKNEKIGVSVSNNLILMQKLIIMIIRSLTDQCLYCDLANNFEQLSTNSTKITFWSLAWEGNIICIDSFSG